MIATSAFFAIFSSFIPGHSDRDGNTFGYHTNVWVCVVLSGIDTKSNKKEENCEKIILLLNKILSSHTSESNQQSSNLRFTSLGHFKSNLCKKSNCRYFFFAPFWFKNCPKYKSERVWRLYVSSDGDGHNQQCCSSLMPTR